MKIPRKTLKSFSNSNKDLLLCFLEPLNVGDIKFWRLFFEIVTETGKSADLLLLLE